MQNTHSILNGLTDVTDITGGTVRHMAYSSYNENVNPILKKKIYFR